MSQKSQCDFCDIIFAFENQIVAKKFHNISQIRHKNKYFSLVSKYLLYLHKFFIFLIPSKKGADN